MPSVNHVLSSISWPLLRTLPTSRLSLHLLGGTFRCEQGAAMTRLGWTAIDPQFALPAFHPELVKSMPPMARLKHWWWLRRGKERRL